MHMPKAGCTAINLSMPDDLVATVKTYAAKNRKPKGWLSDKVAQLLVRELRAKGVKLPESVTKKA